MKQSEFVARDGARLVLGVWDDVVAPKAVVQLVHGMNEHCGRYEAFAAYLNGQGYVVVGDDHRAHGRTAGSRDRIGKTDGLADLYATTVDDELELTAHYHALFGLPVVVLGHSYGSFLAQTYMLHRTVPACVRGFVLTGAAKQSAFMIRMGRLFAAGNADAPATAIASLTFGAYDKHFKEGRNAWLTKDTAIVEAYNSDPFIIDVFGKGFYRSFFRNMSRIFKKADASGVRDLPILIACGADDGVGGYGKYSKALYRALCGLGCKDLHFTLYPTDRHEILNETDRGKVYADIAEFLTRCVG